MKIKTDFSPKLAILVHTFIVYGSSTVSDDTKSVLKAMTNCITAIRLYGSPDQALNDLMDELEVIAGVKVEEREKE